MIANSWRARRDFASRIAAQARITSPELAEAFASVPREAFLGPGPWKVMRPPFTGGYVDTPDADPTHVYDTVAVAIDATRNLNNGEPSGLALWLEALGVRRGVRFLHLGCGVGYYTAVVARATGSDGSVVAIEADADLAERARRNLADYGNVEVRCGTGTTLTDRGFDAIFVNAGATEVLAAWLDHLDEGGRLLVPLTTSRSFPGVDDDRIGFGQMLLVNRQMPVYAAHFVSPVGIFHCIGARTTESEEALRAAYQRGDATSVRSLRRDRHEQHATCWLHRPLFCLSRTEP